MCIINIYCERVYYNSSVKLILLTRYCFIPPSVNEYNLREVYTIAPREVRQMGNDYVRWEMMTYEKNLDSASNRPVVMRFQLI
jgi:hypothetical protein